MISALEHYSYCPRQCALIHLEQTFDENFYTIRGKMLHEKVDSGIPENIEGLRVERSLPVWSKRLGLTGKADLVEFRAEGPYPVEYKSGKKRKWLHETIQLCAQALCLEEMLGQAVPKGAIYYISSKRRREVVFEPGLKNKVEEMTCLIRKLLDDCELPPPLFDERCEFCSLSNSCLPGAVTNKALVRSRVKLLFDPEDS